VRKEFDMQMRVLAAAAVTVSAAVHLWLWFDGYRDESVVGPLFLLNVAGGLTIAALLLRWDHWIPPFLAAGFGVSTLAGFVISATVGLFGLQETWSGFAVWAAAISEVVAIVAGSIALLRSDHPQSVAQAQHGRPVSRQNLH
jgi:hypothetical protein